MPKIKTRYVRINVYDKPGKGRIKIKCGNCKKIKYKIKSRVSVGTTGLNFCNGHCKNQAQKIGGVLAPAHAGKTKKYRVKAFRAHAHLCNKCGYCRNPKVLQVHHIDSDHANNDVDNLEILCPTCHMEIHHGSK